MSQSHRISVGLSNTEYTELKALSEQHRVSLAWIGRQAIVEFIERFRNKDLQLPLVLVHGPSQPSNDQK